MVCNATLHCFAMFYTYSIDGISPACTPEPEYAGEAPRQVVCPVYYVKGVRNFTNQCKAILNKNLTEQDQAKKNTTY